MPQVEQEDKLTAEKQLQKKKMEELSRKRGELFRNQQTARQSGPARDHTDSMVRCPHCNRTFAEAPAERHIPGCGERTRAAADRAKNKARRWNVAELYFFVIHNIKTDRLTACPGVGVIGDRRSEIFFRRSVCCV